MGTLSLTSLKNFENIPIYFSFIIIPYVYIWERSHMFVYWNKIIHQHMGTLQYWYIWEYLHMLIYGRFIHMGIIPYAICLQAKLPIC